MGLLRRAAFARLWAAAFFSESAEWMLQVALPVYLYQLTGSAASTATGMVLGLVPAVLLSPVAGVLADRWNRRVVLAVVCAGQAVVALPLLLAGGSGEIVLVYSVQAAQAGLASLFEPARNALVPELVDHHELTAANGLLSVTNSLARLAGSSAGGLLLGLAGLGGVVAAYLGVLLVSAALLLRRFRTATVVRPVVRSVAVPVRRSMLREWLAGVAEVRHNRTLRVTAFAVALMSVAQGMFLVLFVLFVLKTLGGGEPEIGLLRGIQAIGGLVAGFALAMVARRVPPAVLLGWGAVALGLLSALTWNTAHVTTAIGVFAVFFAVNGAPGTVVGAGQLAVMQAATGPDLLGRVLSTAFAGMAGFQALGMQLAGLLVGWTGLWPLLDAQAVLHVLAGVLVLGMLKPVRAGDGYGGGRASPLCDQRPARHP
ncbi:MFS transporter [Amycolatopsis nigrescens]|uniref:MFS transporter n=1 Tax=Amycolatopsis nigrescens TaxID=381445 RepID=UPI00035E0630|nr:MFS transporter [Amycolatopsis nigrescens]